MAIGLGTLLELQLLVEFVVVFDVAEVVLAVPPNHLFLDVVAGSTDGWKGQLVDDFCKCFPTHLEAARSS
jgi:hypothetical protein